MCGAAKSSERRGQSDEPFTIRDIQFNNPQVLILARAAGHVFRHFLFIFLLFVLLKSPFSAIILPLHTVKKPHVCAVLGQQNKDRTGLAFTFVEHGGKSACTRNLPQQC